MKPGGGYFGAKKALEPVHVIWDYDTNQVKVFNSTLVAYQDMTVSAGVYNIPDLTQKYTYQATLDVPANRATQAFTIPAITGLSTTYFIRLELKDSANRPVSSNLYWYSTTKDELGGEADWYMTPVSAYADLSGLNGLVVNRDLNASASAARTNDQETVNFTVRNPSSAALAFFVRLEVTRGQDGEEALPVTYNDNYITLWPGESITIVAQYATADLGGQPAYVRVRGYNVPAFSILIP
jgi:exo-1,4-beta-D-glucosaminidase